MKVNSNIDKIIVILGGVGPAAGVDLHRLVIENTPHITRDQDHLRVIHLSFSDLIPDRTESLKNNTTDIPSYNMALLVESIIPTCDAFHCQCVVGIPCNTFHAPAIFNSFLAYMKPYKKFVKVVHMIDETINYLATIVEKGDQIGILSTTGTRNARLYDDQLKKREFNPLYVDDQENIHSSIYHPTWGIKAVSGESDENKGILFTALEELYRKGAKAIILACTEIPLVVRMNHYKEIPLINPVSVLAKALIREARNESKL